MFTQSRLATIRAGLTRCCRSPGRAAHAKTSDPRTHLSSATPTGGGLEFAAGNGADEGILIR